MEICGSILTNSEYTVFYLKCIYCSIESDLKDWKSFVSHTRNAHCVDNSDPGSVQSENEVECTPEEPYEENEVMNHESFIEIKEESESWLPDDEDLYETIETQKVEEDPQSPNRIEPQSLTYYTREASIGIEDVEPYRYESECQITDDVENLMQDDTSEDSYNYEENEDEDDSCESSDSEREIEERKPKRCRTSPMALKRKLKVSFNRTNPRVLHFIEEFKKHPCLWNPNDKFFKNETAEAEAFNAIIEGMDKKVNVLFNVSELKASIQQLLNQFEMASQKVNEGQLSGVTARYLRRCKYLAISNCPELNDDEESKSDVIQLNFKEINEITTTFIEIYANFPVLYDSSLPDFKSVNARTDAYIQMAQLLAPGLRVNETEVYLAVMRLRKWAYMTLRRVKSKDLRRACSKSELHYLQLCSFLPPKAESFVINCEYCNKRFFIDYSLRAHMVKVHDVGELPYLCSQCPRRFEKAHDMERHKLRQHCEKLLKCDFCDSTFSMKNDLKVHIRVHTGEKPYVCEICGKSFRLKLLLDYHINGFHLNLRPYKCDICHNTYRKRVQLKNHMKAHLNIKDKKCEECGAAFTCPTSLSRHRKNCHNNQKLQK